MTNRPSNSPSASEEANQIKTVPWINVTRAALVFIILGLSIADNIRSFFGVQPEIHNVRKDGKEVPTDREFFYGVELPRISLTRKRALLERYDAEFEEIKINATEEAERRKIIEDENGKIKKWAEKNGKKIKTKYAFDEVSKNIVRLRANWHVLSDEPLVSFQIPGHPHRITLRQEIAIRFLAAIDDYIRETGNEHPILLKENNNPKDRKRPYGRTNADQQQDWDIHQAGGPVAAHPHGGMHLRFMAVDLGWKWPTYKPYFERYGFIGGPENGIEDDENHFDIGRIKKPIDIHWYD